MDKDKFWQMIDDAREKGNGDWRKMYKPLREALSKLDKSDILHWQLIFNEYQKHSDKPLIASVAALINDGISDDGFWDFRGWLIAQGEDVYFSTLANPDSLSNHPAIYEFILEKNSTPFEPMSGFKNRPQFEAMLYIAAYAYEDKTGNRDDYYNRRDNNSLTVNEKDSIIAELKFAKNINERPERADSKLTLEKSFPRLHALVSREFTAGKNRSRQVSAIQKIKHHTKEQPQHRKVNEQKKGGPER